MTRDDNPPLGPLVDDAPARRPEPVTLAGRHVVVAPLEPSKDAAELFAATSGPEHARLFAYLFTGPFSDEAAFRADIDASAASPDLVPLAIRDARSGRTVGRASYMRIEPRHRVIEVGSILFTSALQRTPAATEAMYLMARHAFEDLGYRRYEWKCDALNAPSRAAAARLGFRFEGVFAKHMIIRGRSRDTAWFAMTDDDWPRVKAAFERWLDPANFGPDGAQKRRLDDIRAAL
ncbi:GNAT family N-acetyltransferase [Methylopila turkensis]|uniref:N-acetyltransferase n=1 Tax=Methylopila turkensis TaxID=1437816 RepID=A0A9W6JKL5_9HYPH|nr:GNAT family protein [Methylopila turkensis]GLK79381.1 N-acetyltransferase [Methylopila turkensis]